LRVERHELSQGPRHIVELRLNYQVGADCSKWGHLKDFVTLGILAVRELKVDRARRSSASQENGMLAITAIIRVKKGCETAMREALLEVVRSVRANEPATVGYYISQDATDPCVFTTYERYLDRAAMDRHNNSEAVARFFGIAKPMIDGEVTLVTGTELSAKC
jgi:quinol monooxygenase YgiN